MVDVKHLETESAVYGVIVVAGLVVIIGDYAEASWEVLVKVTVTVLVFWVAHVFAGTVAHLSDAYEVGMAPLQRLRSAMRYALDHSWGMLLAVLLPVQPLLLGARGWITDQQAIWSTLWAAVLALAILGWVKVARWSKRTSYRLIGAGVTGGLGLVLILLKTLVH